MSLPVLKQITDLSFSDFERHPAWIGVHNIDFGQPWYDSSDEETFRSWTGALPVAAETGVVLVRASVELHDGGTYPGAIAAVDSNWDRPPGPGVRSISARFGDSMLVLLGIQQPRIFVGQEAFTFWGGRLGVPSERRQALYTALGKMPTSIFPLRFSADPQFATGILTGQVNGFYRSISGQPPQVEI
jgi:hypothetical protein